MMITALLMAALSAAPAFAAESKECARNTVLIENSKGSSQQKALLEQREHLKCGPFHAEPLMTPEQIKAQAAAHLEAHKKAEAAAKIKKCAELDAALAKNISSIVRTHKLGLRKSTGCPGTAPGMPK